MKLSPEMRAYLERLVEDEKEINEGRVAIAFKPLPKGFSWLGRAKRSIIQECDLRIGEKCKNTKELPELLLGSLRAEIEKLVHIYGSEKLVTQLLEETQ